MQIDCIKEQTFKYFYIMNCMLKFQLSVWFHSLYRIYKYVVILDSW